MPGDFVVHDPDGYHIPVHDRRRFRQPGCPVCRRADEILSTAFSPERHEAEVTALFDLADRAAHARQVYGRRKRGRWR